MGKEQSDFVPSQERKHRFRLSGEQALWMVSQSVIASPNDEHLPISQEVFERRKRADDKIFPESSRYPIFDTFGVNTEEKNIKWNGLVTEFLVTEDIFGNRKFKTQDIQTERIIIRNYYFNESGGLYLLPQQGGNNVETRSWSNPIGGRALDRTNPRGVCGEGSVERGQFSVGEETAAGTGPGNCPWD